MIPLDTMDWASLPVAVQVGLVLLVAAQLVLLVWALLAWARTPEDGFTGSRWVWLAVILLGQLLGPLVFLIFGRRPPTVEVHRETPGDADSTLDLLYGKPDA